MKVYCPSPNCQKEVTPELWTKSHSSLLANNDPGFFCPHCKNKFTNDELLQKIIVNIDRLLRTES